jgi:aldose 1-epimerase
MTKSGLDPKRFEATVEGKKTALYVLENSNGMEVCICNYGGTIVSVMTPDRNGKLADVVLGYDSIEAMLHAPEPTFGTAIGRYGNRIANAKFSLGGKEYEVNMSQKPNCLHGGFKGFHFKVWDVLEANKQSIRISYLSVDGEEGFPGNLKSEITYTLTDDNAVRIDYSATTDKLTLCNLTNHSYFNLAGVQDVTPLVNDHVMTLYADRFVPINEVCIPLGDRADVAGTPFDFRTPHTLGERIDADDVQIKNGAGYDHCFCVNQDTPDQLGVKGLKKAAYIEEPGSGRTMTAYTTEPGIQLYTANWLSGFAGIGGCKFPARSAFCLEAQHHPDSPNQPKFEQATLAPGETYRQVTVYAFGVK